MVSWLFTPQQRLVERGPEVRNVPLNRCIKLTNGAPAGERRRDPVAAPVRMANDDIDVASWFENILARTARGRDVSMLPYPDQAVYYVVSVRMEADVNGFCSVFEQFLTHEADVAFLVRVLRHLEENDLADGFVVIQRLLSESGFFEDPTREFHALRDDVLDSFRVQERRILGGDRLWDLDAKLLRLRERV